MAKSMTSGRKTASDKIDTEAIELTTDDKEIVPETVGNTYDDILEENRKLKEQLENQEKKFSSEIESIKLLLRNQIESTTATSNNRSDNFGTIRPDKYIKIMSLTHNLLNLNAGNGKIIKIQKYGQLGPYCQ